jgi:hypothetical protein
MKRIKKLVKSGIILSTLSVFSICMAATCPTNQINTSECEDLSLSSYSSSTCSQYYYPDGNTYHLCTYGSEHCVDSSTQCTPS